MCVGDFKHQRAQRRRAFQLTAQLVRPSVQHVGRHGVGVYLHLHRERDFGRLDRGQHRARDTYGGEGAEAAEAALLSSAARVAAQSSVRVRHRVIASRVPVAHLVGCSADGARLVGTNQPSRRRWRGWIRRRRRRGGR